MEFDVLLVASYLDLKQKSAGKGGFSDGGVKSESVALLEKDGSPQVVEIAPPPGVCYGRSSLLGEEVANSVSLFNFDKIQNVAVREFFVTKDGEEIATGAPSQVNANSTYAFEDYFSKGAILQHPNKLRYKVEVKGDNPNDRVLLKYTVVEYDEPA